MRIRHRLTILVPLLLATAVVSESKAQSMMGFPSYGAPAFMAGPGSQGAYQGMPQSFQSHPMISPFDHAMEQHFSSDGIWFRRALSGLGKTNETYFNVEYIRTKVRGLKGVVGDYTVPTPGQDAVITAIPHQRLDAVDFADDLFLPTFPHQYTDQLLPIRNDGVKLSGGIRNQMGWRLGWNAAYFGESTNTWDARANLNSLRLHFFDALSLEASGGVANGSGLPNNLRAIDDRAVIESQILNARTFDAADAEDFGVLGTTSEILDRHLYPFGSIGIRNGTDLDGTSQMFDMDYIIKHEVQSWGGGMHISSSPIYENGSFQVRPLIGGRVFRLQEGFRFFGVDSGLDYTANPPDYLDDDDDFIIDNVAENGTDNFTDPITDDTQEILVRSFVNSQVRSTMSGPEIGLEYEIAERKGITFAGSTRVGALFNVEKMYLSGDNIGDTFATEIDVATGNTVRSEMFDTSTAGGVLTQNYFEDYNSTTHLSPLFEQSLSADVPIFSNVPVLRDVWQLENARLRVSWTYTWIGEVADPNQSIVWVSNPRAGVFPYLKSNRVDYFQNTFSAGINWEF